MLAAKVLPEQFLTLTIWNVKAYLIPLQFQNHFKASAFSYIH